MHIHVADDGSVVTDKEARALLAPIMQDKEETDMSKPSILKRHAYYEEHKQEIIRDSLRMTLPAFRQMWSMPASSWVGLRKRWAKEIAAEKARPGQGAKIPGEEPARLPSRAVPQAVNGQLHMPPWDGRWANEVKVAWLNAYARLFGPRKPDGKGNTD